MTVLHFGSGKSLMFHPSLLHTKKDIFPQGTSETSTIGGVPITVCRLAPSEYDSVKLYVDWLYHRRLGRLTGTESFPELYERAFMLGALATDPDFQDALIDYIVPWLNRQPGNAMFKQRESLRRLIRSVWDTPPRHPAASGMSRKLISDLAIHLSSIDGCGYEEDVPKLFLKHLAAYAITRLKVDNTVGRGISNPFEADPCRHHQHKNNGCYKKKIGTSAGIAEQRSRISSIAFLSDRL